MPESIRVVRPGICVALMHDGGRYAEHRRGLQNRKAHISAGPDNDIGLKAFYDLPCLYGGADKMPRRAYVVEKSRRGLFPAQDPLT